MLKFKFLTIVCSTCCLVAVMVLVWTMGGFGWAGMVFRAGNSSLSLIVFASAYALFFWCLLVVTAPFSDALYLMRKMINDVLFTTNYRTGLWYFLLIGIGAFGTISHESSNLTKLTLSIIEFIFLLVMLFAFWFYWMPDVMLKGCESEE